jgi:hypothetical protein
MTAIIVGVLFLTVMFTYTLGAFVFIDPILNAPDYLINISANKTQVIIGVLLELINGIAYVGIAVLVFPILKQFNESMALGYVGFRIIEFAMQIVSDISPLLLITLSQEFLNAGAPDASSFQPLSTLLLAERYWANQMVFIAYGLGALIFYYLLHQSKLIPRFLSVWGLIGAPLVLINVMLEIFGFNPALILGFQMGLNEIVLGIWLIVKGFNSSAIIVSRSAKTDINEIKTNAS